MSNACQTGPLHARHFLPRQLTQTKRTMGEPPEPRAMGEPPEPHAMGEPPEPLCPTLDAVFFFFFFFFFFVPNRTRLRCPHFSNGMQLNCPRAMLPPYWFCNHPRVAPHYLDTYPRAALQQYLVLFYPSPLFCKAWGSTEKRYPSENNIKKLTNTFATYIFN